MSLSKAIEALKSFGATHKPDFPQSSDGNPVVDGNLEVILVSEELFNNAVEVANHLSFPVLVHYIEDGGKEKFRDIVIHEIRQVDQDSYIFRAECDDTGKERYFSTDRINELYAGEMGTKYLRDAYMTDENASWIEKAADNPFFSTIASGLSFVMGDMKDRKPIAPSIADFIKPFDIFAGDRFLNFRQKLHVFIYLARADKHYCENEQRYVNELVSQEASGSSLDAHGLYVYAGYCFVTYNGFVDALNTIATLPQEEVRALIEQAKLLIEADGKITSDERTLYDAVMKELS